MPEDLRSMIYQMLTPNDTLDVRLFDFRGKMHQEVKKQLLVNAEYIIKQTIKGIDGLVVHDIYLTGSSAGYFYNEKSDIDVGIEVHNESCPYISQDEDKLADFLLKVFYGNCRRVSFVLDNRSVDINLESHDKEVFGLYSLLQDEWVLEPNKKIFAGIEVEEVWRKYNERYAEINQYIDNMQANGQLKEKQGILELTAYFRNLLKQSLVSPMEYIIYRLLKKRLVFVYIGGVIYKSWQDYLSLE